MHPITLPIAELKPALAGLAKVLNTRATLPILHHLKIERTSEGWIALTATDLDRYITIRLEQPAEGSPLTVLVPYDQLLQLTKNCGKGESILIEKGLQDTLLLSFAVAHNLGATKVKFENPDEFPATPRIKGDSFPLPPEVRQSLHEAMDCASTDQTRYVITGAFIDAENPKANYVVGTDGRHLYSANSFALPLERSLIIPPHKFLTWKEFNNDGEWQMKADDKAVQITSRRWRFLTKHIDGQYPNWRQVMPDPKDAKTHITIDPAKLEAISKLIQRLPCHEEKFHSMGLEWKTGQLHLLAKQTAQEPWIRVPIPDIKGEGPEVTMFTNRRHLDKALRFGLNTLSLADALSPLRCHHRGKQMIVMPVRGDPEDEATPPAKEQRPMPANDPAPQPLPRPAPPPRQEPQPQQERTPAMIAQSAPEEPAPNGQKNPIEDAIDLTLKIRDTFQEGLNGLRELHGKLKTINRDNRTSGKELNSLRTRLRSLKDLTF